MQQTEGDSMKLEITWNNLVTALHFVRQMFEDKDEIDFGPEVMIYAEGPARADEIVENEPTLFTMNFQFPTLGTAVRINEILVSELLKEGGGPIGVIEFLGSRFVPDGGPEDLLIPDLNLLLESANSVRREAFELQERIRRARNVVYHSIKDLKKTRQIFPDKNVREARISLTSLMADGEPLGYPDNKSNEDDREASDGERRPEIILH